MKKDLRYMRKSIQIAAATEENTNNNNKQKP